MRRKHAPKKNIIGIILVAFLLVALILFKQSNPTSFCANSISCIKNLSGLYEEGSTNAQFQGKTLEAPKELAQIPKATNVLGNTTEQKKNRG